MKKRKNVRPSIFFAFWLVLTFKTRPRIVKNKNPSNKIQELRNDRKPTKVLNAAFLIRAKLLLISQDHANRPPWLKLSLALKWPNTRGGCLSGLAFSRADRGEVSRKSRNWKPEGKAADRRIQFILQDLKWHAINSFFCPELEEAEQQEDGN